MLFAFKILSQFQQSINNKPTYQANIQKPINVINLSEKGTGCHRTSCPEHGVGLHCCWLGFATAVEGIAQGLSLTDGDEYRWKFCTTLEKIKTVKPNMSRGE
jgi:hypothetical protein